MSTAIKKTLACILGLTSISASATTTTDPLYIMFYFNTRSISDSITDKQCEDIFKISSQYTIINDVVVYKQHEGYKTLNYQRTNVTYLNKDQYLFTGSSNIEFSIDGKTHSAKQASAFVLTISDQKVQGSFILDGYCTGNLLGTNQNSNQWPPL